MAAIKSDNKQNTRWYKYRLTRRALDRVLDWAHHVMASQDYSWMERDRWVYDMILREQRNEANHRRRIRDKKLGMVRKKRYNKR